MTVAPAALARRLGALIEGHQLPRRWQRRERFVVLEAHFGAGNGFLATWHAWRADPQRCSTLVFIAIHPDPPGHADLVDAHRDSPWRELADALHAAWPPLTPNLHRLSFDEGKVQLLLMFADVRRGLPELVADVDTFFLDGAESASNRGAWDERACKALGRLAAPGASLSAPCASPELRGRLTSAGFKVHLPSDAAGRPDILLATFAPSFTPRRVPPRIAAPPPRRRGRRALIVGGGLAGCAAAWALAEQGWDTCVLERRPAIASEGSGNPGGLFHGIVNAQDGRHARFNRAAALEGHSAVQVALRHHGVAGGAHGLLRLESVLGLAAMRSILARLGLPPAYVQAVDADQACALAGVTLALPAWFYPGGGWVHPGELARSFVERAGGHATLSTGLEVHALVRTETGWRLDDEHGASVDAAEVIVLANAGDAIRLLGDAGPPMRPVRGQISMLAASALALPRMPNLPIAGAGYLLPEVNGKALFGATAQPGDPDASVRAADHVENLARLERLIGMRLDVEPQRMEGRTAWRWVTADRLPVIGAVPDVHRLAQPHSHRLDQPRFVPRLPGLFVFTALGSRGITWSALGAQVLASLISGAPAPIEASLLDAVDPARFITRRARRAA